MHNLKVVVSCSGKFHAFELAQQLQRQKQLTAFYTTYAWQKNIWMRRFAGRVDREEINPEYINTNIPLAILLKLTHKEYECNDLFDRWVAYNLNKYSNFDVFIGWSGMALQTIKVAKKLRKITILERGSSHIKFQNDILHEEYLKHGIDFKIDSRTINKEIQEYELCDYISVPSTFVKNSFVDQGVKEEKIFVNPYGASYNFQKQELALTSNRFIILYLGNVVRRKGLDYLFQALDVIDIPLDFFEVWFIGSISDEMRQVVARNQKKNWKFWGYIPSHQLPPIITQCSVGVQPSIEEGLSMVIPQMLACGVPVIATSNTGGGDIIEDNHTGFIIPIRDSSSIKEKIEFLYNNPKILNNMKNNAKESIGQRFTWDDYGNRYFNFISNLAI